MNKIEEENNIFLKSIYNNIIENNIIENGDKIIVCVSGGSDSMFLLHFLIKYKKEFLKVGIEYNIAVCHINHLIREESKIEKEYVEEYCKLNNIKFNYLEVDVTTNSKQNKMGIEEYARKVRYDFFNKTCNKLGYNKIAVAHNKEDNVETILLNIIRGTGLKGLTGMSYIQNNIIRPLLDVTKENINNYCNVNNIVYYVDKTNLQDIYMRNKVRLNLIPLLQNEYNENFVNNILRLSKLARLDDQFLTEYTDEIVRGMIVEKNDDSIVFSYKDLFKNNEAITYRIVRCIIKESLNNLNGIETIHVEDIIRLLKNNITGKKYIIGNKFEIKIIKKNIAVITLR